MVAKKKVIKGRTLHDYYTSAKKRCEGRILHDLLHNGLMRRTAHFATLNLRIHFEFLNNEWGNEKDK